jgi:chromosome segregation ATPase
MRPFAKTAPPSNELRGLCETHEKDQNDSTTMENATVKLQDKIDQLESELTTKDGAISQHNGAIKNIQDIMKERRVNLQSALSDKTTAEDAATALRANIDQLEFDLATKQDTADQDRSTIDGLHNDLLELKAGSEKAHGELKEQMDIVKNSQELAASLIAQVSTQGNALRQAMTANEELTKELKTKTDRLTTLQPYAAIAMKQLAPQEPDIPGTEWLGSCNTSYTHHRSRSRARRAARAFGQDWPGRVQ